MEKSKLTYVQYNDILSGDNPIISKEDVIKGIKSGETRYIVDVFGIDYLIIIEGEKLDLAQIGEF